MAQLKPSWVHSNFTGGHCCLLFRSFRRFLTTGYNVIFYGSDQFSLPGLSKLQSSRSTGLVSKLSVVSRANSLIATFAVNNNLPFISWPPDYSQCKDVYDVGFVSSFGHLLPVEAIHQCTYGIINIHASLLPRWRGASPVHHAILAGDEITGVSVMKIDPYKFDTGDVLSYHEYKMPHRPEFIDVFNDLAHLGSQALIDTLADLPNALARAKPQATIGITQAPKPKASDGLIDFTKLTSIEVDRRVRALNGLVKCYTHWIDGSKLRLYKVNDPSITATAQIDELLKPEFGIPEVGSIYYHPVRRELFFKCADDNWVSFLTLGPVNSRIMSASDFYNGFIGKLANKEDRSSLLKIPKSRIRFRTS